MLTIALGCFAGCAQPEMKFLIAPTPPIVWPRTPDAPRVRYIGALTGSADIGMRKPFGEVMDELLYGPKPPARLVSPHAVAVDAAGNRVAVADVNGKCIHLFDLAARSYVALFQVGAQERPADARDAAAGSAPADGPRPGPTLEGPVAVCWAGENLWVADAASHALARFDRGGAGRWMAVGLLQRPSGIAYCPANQLCYVTDAAAHRVAVFDARGNLVSEFGAHGAGPGEFNVPSHIACSDDAVVVADSLNFRVQRFGLDGHLLNSFGRKGDAPGDLALPKGVAVDAGGAIWVVDAQFENVQAFTPEGQLLMVFGNEGHGPGEFWLPAGVCIDRQQRMWIADRENARVQIFSLLPSNEPVVP